MQWEERNEWDELGIHTHTYAVGLLICLSLLPLPTPTPTPSYSSSHSGKTPRRSRQILKQERKWNVKRANTLLLGNFANHSVTWRLHGVFVSSPCVTRSLPPVWARLSLTHTHPAGVARGHPMGIPYWKLFPLHRLRRVEDLDPLWMATSQHIK